MGAVITGDDEGDDYFLSAIDGNGRELTKKRLAFLSHAAYEVEIECIAKAYDPDDPSAIYNVDIDFSGGLRASLPAEVYPKQMILERGIRVYDYNGASDSGWVVSQKFKDLVEEFDKDVHQFFPVEILNKDHSPYEGGNYYFLHTRLPLNAIITEGSNLAEGPKSKVRKANMTSLHVASYSRFTVSADLTKGVGLWREVRAQHSKFVSEALLQRLIEEDLQGWAVHVAFEEV